MKELKDFYRSQLKWLAGVIVTLALAYHGLIVAISDQLLPAAQKLLAWSESILVTVLFFSGEYLIRKHLWKITNREIDFDGNWTATSNYVWVEKGNASIHEGAAGFSAAHSVIIDQDCFSISIRPTPGPYNSWYSLAMNIRSEDKICYAYEANYKDPERFPPEAIGYEEMTVVKRCEKGWRKGQPIELNGIFYHCAKGLTPVYRGTVNFKRLEEAPGATNTNTATARGAK